MVHQVLRRSLSGLAVTTLAAGLALASPLAASAATPPTDFGGATRNSDGNPDTDRTQMILDSIKKSSAKNVILLIGDGMGDSEITVARNYLVGAGKQLPGLDAFPLTGQYTTYSFHAATTESGAADPLAGTPDYVTDSAASGTGWATGTKSYDGAIGVDVNRKAHDNLIEIAKANGKKTGNVTTAEIQDATPAVLGAHVNVRSCYGPDTDLLRAAATPPQSAVCGSDLLENGGRGSITEQLLDTRADITMGGGSASFGQKPNAASPYWKGSDAATPTELDIATNRGYQVVQDTASFNALTSANQNSPVLGLFNTGNLVTRYASTTPTAAQNGTVNATATTCQPNAAYDATKQPTLKAMTQKSIDLLNNPNGFFLQVEGASIDKQDHAANACGQIGETEDLDEAAQVALAFAKADGNTLVIVTADHAHTSQIVDNPTPGANTKLKTKDGGEMIVSYNTAPVTGSQQHTGAQLRIAAYGPGAAKVVGLTDQTDNFFTISNSLVLNRQLPTFSAGGDFVLKDAASGQDDNTATAGQTLAVSASGFGGDRQVTIAVGGVTTRVDVINGSPKVYDSASKSYKDFVFTVPGDAQVGSYDVVVTGLQSGKSVTRAFTVSATGAPGTGTTTGHGTTPAGTTGSSASNGSPLAYTGAVVAPIIALGGLLLAGGAALAVAARLRRRNAMTNR